MERGLMEEESSPSRCSSGCQSGWTLYLDHSDAAQRCCIHLEPGQRWMVPCAELADDEESDDDSMVSDASSGPSPRLLVDDDVELRRDGEHRCYSGCSGVHGSASDSESSYGSWSRIFQDQATRGVAVHDGDQATRQYADDDLDDTASSSAVFSSPTMHGHQTTMMYIAPAESMSSTSYTTL